jgi:hypothetical protein
MGRWPGEPRPMKPPAGQGKPVLYLDFDGVLHHEEVYWDPRRGAYMAAHGHKLFEHVSLLEDLLQPWPEVKIVLSTSWVRQYGFSGTAKRLGPALRARCIGSTWHTGMRAHEWSFARLPRGLQVVQDVQRRHPAAWVAVDDDHGDWPTQFESHLVRSHPFLGISAPTVLDGLREKIAAMVGDPSDAQSQLVQSSLAQEPLSPAHLETLKLYSEAKITSTEAMAELCVDRRGLINLIGKHGLSLPHVDGSRAEEMAREALKALGIDKQERITPTPNPRAPRP